MANQDLLFARVAGIRNESMLDDGAFRAYQELYRRGELSELLVRRIEGAAPILLRFAAHLDTGGRKTVFDKILAAPILTTCEFALSRKQTLGDMLSGAQITIPQAHGCDERFCQDLEHVHSRHVFELSAFVHGADPSSGTLRVIQPTFEGGYGHLRDRLFDAGLRFANLYEYASSGAKVGSAAVLILGSADVDEDGKWFAPMITKRADEYQLTKGHFGGPSETWALWRYGVPVVDL